MRRSLEAVLPVKIEGLTRKQFLKRSIGTVGFLVLYSNGFGRIARHIEMPDYRV